MTTPEHRLRLLLDLDADARRPQGCLCPPAGAAIAFCGWLELMDIVERLLTRSTQCKGSKGQETHAEKLDP